MIVSTKRVLRNFIYRKYDWISKLTVVAVGPLTVLTLRFNSLLKLCLT